MLDMEAQKLKIGSVSKLDALKTKIEWEPESLKLVVVIEAWTWSCVSRKKKGGGSWPMSSSSTKNINK